jgi:hypothetical protein
LNWYTPAGVFSSPIIFGKLFEEHILPKIIEFGDLSFLILLFATEANVPEHPVVLELCPVGME